MTEKLVGKCLCESIEVTVTPNTKNVDICHCDTCRKWYGGPSFALACGSNVELSGDTISAYRSSEWAERVFCNNCGTSITWRLADGSGENHVNSELFRESKDFPLGTQVFIDQKPDNYDFVQQTHTMTGAELFALFAPQESEND